MEAGTRLSVALLVGGFPDAKRPDRSIFNLRAARSIREFADLEVLVLRALRPGRRLVESSTFMDIPVHRVSFPMLPGRVGWNLTSASLCLRRVLRRRAGHLDILHSVSAFLAGAVGSRLRKHGDFIHVCQVIGSDINNVIPELLSEGKLENWQQRVDAVLCNSRALQQTWCDLYGSGHFCRTVYRGTDLARFTPRKYSSEGPIRFLYLGGLPESPASSGFGLDGKGGITLQKAWRSIESLAKTHGGRLVFAGPFADQDVTRKWRDSLKYPELVDIHSSLSPDDMPAYYQNADLVLLPSRAEGLPNVAVEAAACGLPVFGSEVGGVPEIVLDRKTGRLLPPAQPDAWAQAMRETLDDRDSLRYWGETAIAHVREHFDSRLYGPQLRTFYAELLRGGPEDAPRNGTGLS